MSARIQINSNRAAPALGSYSQGLKWNNLFFTTVVPFGMDGEIVGGTIEEQTRQTMQNLKYLLEDAGTDFDHVLRVTAYVFEPGRNLSGFIKTYEEYFPKGDYPARSSHEAALFVHDGRQCLIEMEVIAGIG
ncbi:MAG: RidA family protein [Oscillospiraceae bacterium]|nr:RidA family protein [Oscillospiraceae bacterium]